METYKNPKEQDQNTFVDLFQESSDTITQQKICNRHTQSQVELPKRTSGYSQKYIGILCLMLGCVIISVVIASVISTKLLLQNLPSAVEQQLSKEEFLEQIHVDTSNGELKDLMDSLKSIVRADMENLLNKTKMHIELLLQASQNKSDFNVWKEEIKEDFNRLFQAKRCKTSCLDQVDGDYQSCYTCEGFITCLNGILRTRICAQPDSYPRIYWDDVEKKCLYTSKTCDSSYTLSEDRNK
ncbi:uncharacterized protein LOC134264098 [Saccostrea cucullata]|uniref:uncharacterized protein LOC134264098 n=1 Tax=Saccostrea cuccullata TaxID=36930 RepID=UPI002ED43FD9